MLDVDIMEDESFQLTPEQIELIDRVLQKAAELEGLKKGEVSVSLVGDEEIQQLNKEYRGINRPTDVLSFAIEEMGEGEDMIYFEESGQEAEDYPALLGDIIISIPRAMKQAEEYNHSFERELGFLVVHGFLHLLGYDHQTEEEEKKMFSRQEEVLQAIHLFR
ncbi:rRNA maturation RNase YbeY [Microaerobacter geothermalis]|uniref:rRNA maturation RNase YbeY n=1 Tax=Microaerobacter geothermalis TaxID=674972 RepID=UPI001F2DE91F|nr:rRNA maturation RNase YbeY [Microaerobacter geothermalis]MCF6092823.1 rRNA maturation RNase YbeY [Microaerobacter geothermalis]